ncbi:MAG: hypothetical protein Alpg2KO_06590 [Alphaproteobacteria bacterium]
MSTALAPATSTALAKAEKFSPRRKRSIFGTVTRIMNDGQGRGNFRAYVQTEAGETLRVISKTPLPVEELQDMRITGLEKVSPDPAVACDLIVSLPDQTAVKTRMTQMVDGGAKLMCFGKVLTGEMRPGLTAWMKSCGDRISHFMGRDGVTVASCKPQEQADRTFQQLADLFDGASATDNIAFVDPGAFTPGITGKRGQIKRVNRTLPAALREVTKQAEFKNSFGREAAAFTTSAAPGACRKHRRHVVLAFPTVETSLCFFQRQTGLTVQRFVPKSLGLDARQRRFFEGARTAATLLAREHGIKLPQTRQQQHMVECFADSFAILALQKHMGSAPAGEAAAKLCEQAALAGPITRATGRAARAAASWGRTAFKDGTLGRMTTRDMLQQAATISTALSLNVQEMRQMRTLRERIARLEGITLGKDFAVPVNKSGVFHARLARNPKLFTDSRTEKAMRLVTPALGHVAENTYSPTQLRDPKMQQRLLANYRNDVANSLLSVGKIDWKLQHMVNHERREHGFNAEAVNWKAHNSRYQPAGWAPSDTLSGKRLALIDLLKESAVVEPPQWDHNQPVLLAKPGGPAV